MKKSELIKLLEGVPDDAIVYVCSDHGQCPEQCGSIDYSDCDELPYSDCDGDVFMHPDDRGYEVEKSDATSILLY